MKNQILEMVITKNSVILCYLFPPIKGNSYLKYYYLYFCYFLDFINFFKDYHFLYYCDCIIKIYHYKFNLIHYFYLQAIKIVVIIFEKNFLNNFYYFITHYF